MSSKQAILGRIREALAHPSHPEVRALAGNGERDVRKARPFMPPGGDNIEERLRNFARLAELLKVELVQVPTPEAARETLKILREAEGWTRIATHHHDLTDRLVTGLHPDLLWTDTSPGIDALESCEVGISVCEALIAQTGSILVTGKGCGGRALSVLPPHHVVLATRDQLLPDLFAGYEHLRHTYGDTLPSFISFITGASRTGDIERILVLGAHGPKRLTVVLMGTEDSA
ncbi:MAG: LUD domain-containing protein [Kiritimatiellia bacterium]